MRTVVTAYRDAYNAMLAMPRIAAAGLMIGVLQAFASLLLPRNFTDESFPLQLAATILWSMLLTPILIAVHRFILLGEVTVGYRIKTDTRHWRFFSWYFYLGALGVLAGSLLRLTTAVDPMLNFFVWPLLLAVIYFTLRLTILFPAIAVNAPGATWRNAYRDTKGHVLSIVFAFVLASLPLLVPVAVVAWVAGPPNAPLSGARLVSEIALGATSIFFTAVFVAIASRFYQWMGDSVKRGAV